MPGFHSISIDHPRDGESIVTLVVDRGLKTGKLDRIPLTEDDLVQLIAQASDKLRILKGLAR
jgi:hypothetical protein